MTIFTKVVLVAEDKSIHDTYESAVRKNKIIAIQKLFPAKYEYGYNGLEIADKIITHFEVIKEIIKRTS